MKYIKLKNTDLEISQVTLGTWVFSGDVWGGAKERESIDAVLAAIDNGINIIDTAPIYGYGISEEVIGKAIKGKRYKTIIATKCGLIGKGKNITTNLTPESIFKEVDDSLRRLQIDYIDIYQCHWPDPKTPIEKTLSAMLKLIDQGKIKNIGVSNFDAQLLQKSLNSTNVVTLQSHYSMLERSIEKDVLPLATEKGVGILTYGPLAGGILTGKYTNQTNFPKADARTFFYKHYSGEQFVKVQKLIDKLKKFGRPLNQIAINWLRQKEGVSSVIVGCRNVEQVKQNSQAADWNLTKEQMDSINYMLDEINR